MGQDPIFDVPSNRTGKNNFLEVAIFCDQVFHRVAMRDPFYSLCDDRQKPFMEGRELPGKFSDLQTEIR